MRVAVAASLLKSITPESTGGTEAFAHILTEGLVAAGQDVTIFATSDSKTSAKLSSVTSSAQTTGVYEGNVEIRTVYQLYQIADILKRSSEFDIIHNNYFGFYMMTSFSAFTNCPIVTTMHNHFWRSPNLQHVLAQTIRKNKDMVVFPSEAARRYAGDLFDTEVIPHGIAISAFTYSATPDDYFLYLGRIVPRKGVDDAIAAAREGGFKLKIAGGPAVIPEEKEFVAKQVVPYYSETIVNVGTPTEDERNKLYQGAKALLFPTHIEEMFGLVAAEAMASGTPVIAYNNGAIAEVIKDGVTGFIIDSDDQERPGKGSWIIKKQGIAGLVEAVSRIGEINRADCRKHVEDNFTREKMINRYIELYKRLM